MSHARPIETFVNAALQGNLPLAKSLWATGRDSLRLEPAAAVMIGDLEAVKRLLEIDPTLIRASVAPLERPLLCYLCFSRLMKDPELEGDLLEVARFLLKSGADPDSCFLSEWGTEEWRETALYGAAGVLNHPGLTKMLLDAGADPDDGAIQDGVYHGESLYHACDFPGQNECLKLLLEANPSQIAADYSLKRKLDFEDQEGVRLFLDAGTNPNANRPRTALSHAILRGRSIQILQMLIDSGADPNQPDEDGTTAYVLARRLANKEAAALLEQHGAIQEFQIHDAILIAAADGDDETVRRLAQAHPDVVAAFTNLGRQENDGFSLGSSGQVLHDLARLGHTSALKALLDLGMNPNLTNPPHETALHWACLAGRADAAKLLLEHGARMDIRETTHQCVAIQWAYWGSEYWQEPHGDYARTVEVLIDFGMTLPENVQGSEEVRSVLTKRGVRA